MSQATVFAGLRILVAEDEAIVAALVEDMLGDLGCKVVGPIPTVAKGLATAATETLDCALLDINLRGEPVYPLAEALIARGVPVAFVTGYGAAGIDRRFVGAPVVAKPYVQAMLERVLVQLVDGRQKR